MTDPSIWTYVVSALIGSLIGGGTNCLAVAMLFRPYNRKFIWRLPLPFTPGLVPKRRAALAAKIGEVVSSHLIPPEQLISAFGSDDVRDAIKDRIGANLKQVLSKPLAESAVGVLGKDWDELVDQVCPRLESTLREALTSREFHDAMTPVFEAQMARLRGMPIDALLGKDLMDVGTQLVRRFVRDTIASPQTRERVLQVLESKLEDILQSERSFDDIFGEGFFSSLEKWICDLMADRVGAMLHRVLHSAEAATWLDEQVRQLLDQQGFFIRTFGPEAEDLVEQIREWLAELPDNIYSRKTQRLFAQIVRDVLQRVASRSLRDLVRVLNASDYIGLKRRLLAVVGDALFSDEMGERAADAVVNVLLQNADTRVEDVLSRLDEGSAAVLRERLDAGLRGLLADEKAPAGIVTHVRPYINQRIGAMCPADMLSVAMFDWVAQVATDNIQESIHLHAPDIIRHIDIRSIVEQRINEFPIDRLHRIVRETAKRELGMIELLGFVIGLVVGGLYPWIAGLLGG